MNDKYMEVPNDILTGKDLDYLCDMFQWNYGALKSSNDFISNITYAYGSVSANNSHVKITIKEI